MTERPADGGDTSGSRTRRQRRHPVAVALALGFAVHVGLRVILAESRYGPMILADEIGYLVNARFLAGGPAGQMSDAMFYRGGYSLLVAPGTLVGDDPHTAYRVVLTINALLTSAVFPLLYVLLTRAFAVPVVPALVTSFVAACYPPIVIYSQVALSEAALYPLVLLAAVLLARLVASRTARQAWTWAPMVGVVGGYLYFTHGRAAPVVAVLLGALVVLGLLRRDLRAPAAVAVVVTGTLLVAGQAVNDMLLRASWGEGSAVSGSEAVLSHLGDEGIGRNVAVSLVGQYWYFFLGTFGLAALGMVEAVSRLRRTERSAGWLPRLRERVAADTGGGQVVAGFLLLSLVGVMVLTGLFLFPPNRGDLMIYGRYSEAVLPAFLALGAYRLWYGPPWRRVAVEWLAAAGVTLVGYLAITEYADGLVHGTANPYTTLAVTALSGGPYERVNPGQVLVVGLIGAAVVLILRAGRARLVGGAVLTAAMVWVSAATTTGLMEYTHDRLYGPDNGAVIVAPGLDVAQNVGYDTAYPTLQGRWAYQWLLPDTHFVLFNSTTDPLPPVRYVVTTQNWPLAARHGAELVSKASYVGQAVYLIPGRPPAPPTTTDQDVG